MKDPYSILGVSRDADEKEIRRAYISLAKKYHPDRYKDEAQKELAEESMKEINAAYDMIKDGGSGYSGEYNARRAPSAGDFRADPDDPIYIFYTPCNSTWFYANYGVTGAVFTRVEHLIKDGRLDEAEDVLTFDLPRRASTCAGYCICYALLYIAKKDYDRAYDSIMNAYYRNRTILHSYALEESRIIGIIDSINKAYPTREEEDKLVFAFIEKMIESRDSKNAKRLLDEYNERHNACIAMIMYLYARFLVMEKRYNDANHYMEIAINCYDPRHEKEYSDYAAFVAKKSRSSIMRTGCIATLISLLLLPIWLPILILVGLGALIVRLLRRTLGK